MKYSEIQSLTDEEIVEKIAEEKDAISKLKFAHAISQIENPMQIRTARKHIARLETELSTRSKNNK